MLRKGWRRKRETNQPRIIHDDVMCPEACLAQKSGTGHRQRPSTMAEAGEEIDQLDNILWSTSLSETTNNPDEISMQSNRERDAVRYQRTSRTCVTFRHGTKLPPWYANLSKPSQSSGPSLGNCRHEIIHETGDKSDTEMNPSPADRMLDRT